MNIKTIVFSAMTLLSLSFAQEVGQFQDPRDNKLYKTVTYADAEWFAENLNYKTSDSYCLFDKRENCETFGRLYKERSIKDACPAGWHASTWTDWVNLVEELNKILADEEDLISHGDPKTEGKVMWAKSTMYSGWIPNPETDGRTRIANSYGKNQSKFSALPGGVKDGSGKYVYIPQLAFLWVAGENPIVNRSIVMVLSDSPDIVGDGLPIQVDGLENAGVYVRCVRTVRGGLKINASRQDSANGGGLGSAHDSVMKDVAGLQTTGKTQFGGRRGKADGGFGEGFAKGGSGGLGDGMGALLGGGDGGTKAKDNIKISSARDLDIEGSSRSAADIIKVVKQRSPGLRYIYSKHLKKKPGFQGKVTLRFTIAPGGEVISISVASSTTGYGEFDSEVKSAVSRWKFSVVQSGNTTVTIPFTFSE